MIVRVVRLTAVAAAVGCLSSRVSAGEPLRVIQPIHEYFTPFGPPAGPDDHDTYGAHYTHLGTDFGTMGPGAARVGGTGGVARADLRDAGWAGVWHCLAGLARDSATLDFLRVYPGWIRDTFQPRCVGVAVTASGAGRLTLEFQAADRSLLWSKPVELTTDPREVRFDCDPNSLRAAKFLNWTADGGSDVSVDAVGLVVEYPPLSLPERTFLVAYAKLARCAVPGAGLVKDQAHRPAGAFEGLPASGMYALATAAAADRGVVDRQTAENVFADALRAFAALPRADGWLPHFVRRDAAGRYALARGTEFGTVDTSIALHGLLLAARVLGDRAAEDEIVADIRRIRFDRVRGADGFVRYGLSSDGRTPLAGGWTEWGGEAALMNLLERIALGADAQPKMNRSGRVPDGVGFVGEVQSLFYPHFNATEPDSLSGIDWLATRRRLAREQAAAVADTAAGKLGLLGLSAGEGFRGRTYLADGLRTKPTVLHPHYMLMAGLSAASPKPTWERMRAAEAAGLMSPWGLAENVTADLTEYLPVQGSLNAAFECLAAYHLAARTEGRPDAIYEAAATCEATADAVRVFYPDR